MADSHVLVCPPTSAGPSAIPTSTREHCSSCLEEVWTAPSGHALRKQNPQIRIICWLCFYVETVDDEVITMPPTKEQLLERLKYKG